MKVSISLPDEDVQFLDRYTTDHGMASRSAVVQHAIRLLRTSRLANAYEQAWSEWDESADEDLWTQTAADGLQ